MKTAPELVDKKNLIDLHLNEVSKGKWKFFKYLLNVDNFDPQNPSGCQNIQTTGFRLKCDEDLKKRLYAVDGEAYYFKDYDTIQAELTDRFYFMIY